MYFDLSMCVYYSNRLCYFAGGGGGTTKLLCHNSYVNINLVIAFVQDIGQSQYMYATVSCSTHVDTAQDLQTMTTCIVIMACTGRIRIMSLV